jgi:phosphatidylglycerophosphate synthase
VSTPARLPANIDRRPIAARSWRASQAVADWLVRRGASANAVSVAGMIAGLAAGAALAGTSYVDGLPQRLAWLAGGTLIVLRLLANMLDGMVAIGSGRASRIGELYNEVPDRVSDSATLIGLGYAAGGWAALGYLAALAAVFTAYVRAMGKGAGVGQEFIGPFAKPQRMWCVIGCAVYCGFAPAEWLPAVGLPVIVLGVVAVGSLGTAVRRLRRIANKLRIVA